MRDVGFILKDVNALFVIFEFPADNCLQINGVAFCLRTGGEDLAF